MSTSFPLPSSPHWDPRTAQTEPREFHSAWCFLGAALASAVALATTRRATRARLEADSLFCHDTRRGATTAADESATALICPEFRCVRCLLAYRHASKRCVVERRALRSGVDAREREGLAAPGQPRLPREAPSRTRFFFVGTAGRNQHVLTVHPYAFAEKVRPAKAPAATLQPTRTDERERTRPLLPRFGPRMGGRRVAMRYAKSSSEATTRTARVRLAAVQVSLSVRTHTN